jgi:hypothetical protein
VFLEIPETLYYGEQLNIEDPDLAPWDVVTVDIVAVGDTVTAGDDLLVTLVIEHV